MKDEPIAMQPNEVSPHLTAHDRKEKIIEILKDHSKVYVLDLCERFKVSPVTIRTDLRDLDAEGKLRRTHGGAIPLIKTGYEAKPQMREVANLAAKQRIARRAADYVEDGDIIILDAGTTTMELARCITEKKELTVISQDYKIIEYLEYNMEHVELILIGGNINKGFHRSYGPLGLSWLENQNVDKAFVGATAFSRERGFTTPDIYQSEMKRTFIDISTDVDMLVDSSKIDRVSFSQFARIDEIDRFITDSGLSAKAAEVIRGLYDEFELLTV